MMENNTDFLFKLPIIYSWAISVHMSQGLTIAKLCVDLGSSIFEEGQA